LIQIDIEGPWVCKLIAEGIVEESKRPDPVIVIHEDYQIEAYESEPGRWRVRITRVDGAKIKTAVPKGEYPELNPPGEWLTAERAIERTKEVIDAGGMD